MLDGVIRVHEERQRVREPVGPITAADHSNFERLVAEVLDEQLFVGWADLTGDRREIHLALGERFRPYATAGRRNSDGEGGLALPKAVHPELQQIGERLRADTFQRATDRAR